MSATITFTVDDPDKAFAVGEVFQPAGMRGKYQVTRGWINKDGKPEYEAVRVSLNRHELRAKLAKESK